MGVKQDIIGELRDLGLQKSDDKKILELIKYIYIGQNIRSEGILQSDSNLKKNDGLIDLLLRSEILKSRRWYSHKLYILSTNKGLQLGEVLISEHINNEELRTNLIKSLQQIPQLLIGFQVNSFISESFVFDLDYDYNFDWKDLILRHNKVKSYIKEFYSLLVKAGLCVITNDYVSTRGGEKRGRRYVICSDVRQFLESIYPMNGLNSEDILELKSLYIIKEEIEYAQRDATVTISGEEFRKTGNFEVAYTTIEEIIEDLESEKIIKNTTKAIGGTIIFTIVKKQRLDEDLNDLIEGKIQNLIGLKAFFEEIHEEEEQTREDILDENIDNLSELLRNKVNLYKLIAQLSHGKSMFQSNPTTELFAIDLIERIYEEDTLKDFIVCLHQLIIESSSNQILRFIDNKDYWGRGRNQDGYISPKDFMSLVEEGRDINKDNAELFEKSRETLNNLHNLRNHYSHLQDAKRFFESSQIFKRLIDISFPTTDDEFLKTQKQLVEKTGEAIDNLCVIFTEVLLKRKKEKSQPKSGT